MVPKNVDNFSINLLNLTSILPLFYRKKLDKSLKKVLRSGSWTLVRNVWVGLFKERFMSDCLKNIRRRLPMLSINYFNKFIVLSNKLFYQIISIKIIIFFEYSAIYYFNNFICSLNKMLQKNYSFS